MSILVLSLFMTTSAFATSEVAIPEYLVESERINDDVLGQKIVYSFQESNLEDGTYYWLSQASRATPNVGGFEATAADIYFHPKLTTINASSMNFIWPLTTRTRSRYRILSLCSLINSSTLRSNPRW